MAKKRIRAVDNRCLGHGVELLTPQIIFKEDINCMTIVAKKILVFSHSIGRHFFEIF